MRISICIPAYGRKKMLVQALHSILLQEHDDFEVVIRDDDPEHPINPKLPDERFRYFVEPHLGTYSKVANATLKHATGDILYIMGSDDVFAPGALYTVNEVFETEKFGGAFWMYGKTISADSHLRFQGVDGKPATFQDLQKANCVGVPSTFWNRKMMDAAGPFDTRYKWAADYEMWLRFWAIREPLFVDRELGIYRHHEHQMSREQATELEIEAQKISLRHSQMGTIVKTARNKWLAQRAYDGESMPTSHDG